MKYKRKNQAEALTQIIILVVSIIAISWMIGSEVGVVSATEISCANICGDGTLTGGLKNYVYSAKRDENGNCVKDILIKTCLKTDCFLGDCLPETTKPGENILKPFQSTLNNLPITVLGQGLNYGVGKGFSYLTQTHSVNSEKIQDLSGKGFTFNNQDMAEWNNLKNLLGGYKISEEELAEIQKLHTNEDWETLKTTLNKLKKKNKLDLQIGQTLIHSMIAIGIGMLSAEIFNNAGYTDKAVNTGKYVAGTSYFTGTIIAKKVLKKISENVAKKILAKEAVSKFATFLTGKFGGFLFTTAGGLVFSVAITAFYYGFIAKKQATEIVTYNCYNWDPEPKGTKCELCNTQKVPCTEYQCKSLGQACELILDKKDENYGLCVWINKNDNKPPIIRVWEEAPFFDKENYEYIDNKVVAPPDKGVYISYKGKESVSKGEYGTKCIPPFEMISLGIRLDENAMCKISPFSTNKYDEMPNIYLSNGEIKKNHSLILSHSSKEQALSQLNSNYEIEKLMLIEEGASIEELQILEEEYDEQFTLINNREYSYYVRCKDVNGIYNSEQFIFKFCVSDFDGSPPQIIYTEPMSGVPVASGISSQNVTVYLNEPADCKWDRLDKTYSSMSYNMDCYYAENKCIATLDGLQDKTTKNFYFRCKDKPLAIFPDIEESERYTMDYSYKYTLIGTQPLAIESITPNNTIIKDSTSPIPVEIKIKTTAGYDFGKSICSLSLTGNTGTYIDFSKTDSHEHSQQLWFGKGYYPYFIKCTDLGGNSDVSWINFSVEVDDIPPTIVRVFKEGDSLKLITDEFAECVYFTSGPCTSLTFEEGEKFTSLDKGITHTAPWNINTDFYIKCRDEYGVPPENLGCSMVVRPFDIIEVQAQ